MEVVHIKKWNISGNICVKHAVLRICDQKITEKKTALTYMYVTEENPHKNAVFVQKVGF